MTNALKAALDETQRRRDKQMTYNEAHGIIPKTVVKDIRNSLDLEPKKKTGIQINMFASENNIDKLNKLMRKAAEKLDFETAVQIRDRVKELELAQL